MNAKDVILRVYGTLDRLVNAYLADLGDADLLVRPVSGQNHIAWQLGHLIQSERTFLEELKPGSSPALPEGFAETHGRDEAARASEEPGRFLSKEAYLNLWKAQREATVSFLNALPEAELDAPGPERFRKMSPTVGSTLLLVGTHGLMHVGQFVAVRRTLNKPIAI